MLRKPLIKRMTVKTEDLSLGGGFGSQKALAHQTTTFEICFCFSSFVLNLLVRWWEPLERPRCPAGGFCQKGPSRSPSDLEAYYQQLSQMAEAGSCGSLPGLRLTSGGLMVTYSDLFVRGSLEGTAGRSVTAPSRDPADGFSMSIPVTKQLVTL